MRHVIALPFGRVAIGATENGIQYVEPTTEPCGGDNHPLIEEAVSQLRAYSEGRLQTFTVPLLLEGTPFQRTVWEALRDIPYGTVRTYADVARAIGRPTASQAVGQANARNRHLIVIPCHRVVRADGTLGGYRGGETWKTALLTLERGAHR